MHFTVMVFFEMLVQFDRVTGGSSGAAEMPWSVDETHYIAVAAGYMPAMVVIYGDVLYFQ